MSYHRLVATAAALAAAVVLGPNPAHAADSPHNSPGAHTANTDPLNRDGSADFKTFTSPADKTVRLQNSATGTGTGTGTARSRAMTTGRTIYAVASYCATDTGNGTQAAPFCLVQDAVNVAASGDTIQVAGFGAGSSNWEAVTVKTSGISIIGTGNQPEIDAVNNAGGKPTFLLDHVTNVTISHLVMTSSKVPAVQIVGSSGITLDSDLMSAGGAAQALAIDGASSGVTVTRTNIDTGLSSGTGTAIGIASGAAQITLAGNLLAASGISATDVNGLNVTGNTIQRGCGSGVDIEGASTGVSIENNLVEDANPDTGRLMGGSQAQCATNKVAWAPDVVVSAGSSAATTADYNDFYVYGSDATAPYAWAGTTYPTLGQFQTAQPTQGAHDTNDTKRSLPGLLPGPYQFGTMDLALQAGSAAIGSANPKAPGALSSDFYGTTPFTSRGAVEYLSSNPGMAIALTAKDTSAFGVSLNVNVTTVSVPQNVTVDWGDGTTTVQGFNGSGPVTMAPTHTYAKLGKYRISVTDGDTHGNSAANSVQVLTAGSEYTPYGPTRLLDTRNGTGAPRAAMQPGAVARVQVAGNGGIPAGVTAVALNVTVTDATGGGFITAYGEGDTKPTTSNVNFAAGQTVPNLVIVPVGDDGYVDLAYSGWGSIDLIADVTGYFTQSAASGYTPIAPARLVDTRNGSGGGQVGANGSFWIQIAGGAGGQLPATGITGVALNVTVTNPGDAGHLTVYPDGQPAPTASNVNFTAGQTIANAVIVPVGADGRISVLNATWAPSDVIVDVVGYYSDAGKSAYLPILPKRLLDTRATTWKYGPLGGRGYVDMVLGAGQPDLTGFVLNATVTDTADSGHLTVSPDPNSLFAYQNGYQTWPVAPNVSTLNWLAGNTVPNLVQANAGANGIVDFWNESDGNLNLVVDAFGYYQND